VVKQVVKQQFIYVLVLEKYYHLNNHNLFIVRLKVFLEFVADREENKHAKLKKKFKMQLKKR
jgi:flavin-dependent dehydrogenase